MSVITRPHWIRLLNYLLYLTFCTLSGTGLLLEWRLPHGSGNRGLLLFGYSRHDWEFFHLWIGYLFLSLIVLHLILHAKWLWMVAVHKRPLRMTFSLLLGIAVILTLLFYPLQQRIRPPIKTISSLTEENQ